MKTAGLSGCRNYVGNYAEHSHQDMRSWLVESLERFDQNQRIIEEFTARGLANFPCDLARLVHMALLRDVSTGWYRHPALAQMYSDSSVHQALLFCHERLFEKVL